MTFCSIWQFNINTFWTARIWPAWSFNSDRTKHTPSDFQCHICLTSVVFLPLFFKLKPRFPLELFLKQDKYFLKPTADSNLILWLLGVYGQRQSNRCVSWWNSQSFKRFFSLCRLLQQKTMITVENDIVAGDVLLWLRGNFYDSFGSIRNGRHLFYLFFS